MIVLQKTYWHFVAIIKILIYRTIFYNRIRFPFSSTFRERFNLTIEKGGKINIGKNVFFNHDCSVTSVGAKISIGDGTLFGENVKIYCHNHCYKNALLSIKEQGFSSAPVNIGKNCWIGSNVIILKGVNIGDNVVVGAGCIIYQDIPAGSIVINKQEQIIKKIHHN